MILIFRCLLIIGILHVAVGRVRMRVSCSWPGHCAGDSCATDDDCDGELTCINSKCGGGNDTCTPCGYLPGHDAKCNPSEMSDCCKKGQNYPQYNCSPTSKSSAILTLNSFTRGGSGGGAGECFGKFYPDTQPVIALSTGWYNKGSRCGKMITINGNGRSTTAQVVDECDSMQGCDDEHDGQPPCRNNIVDASAAVWTALGISKDDPKYGEINISWSD